MAPQMVNTVFREPISQVLKKIKNEPYFKWPSKMIGDPWDATKASIVNTTKKGDIPLKTAEHYGTI